MVNVWNQGASVPNKLILDRYWVVFAFLSVIESAISVTYWFPFYYVSGLLPL